MVKDQGATLLTGSIATMHTGPMNPVELLGKYFPDKAARALVLEHSRMVSLKAVAIAERLDEAADILFIEQAALLHDIGICRTSAPAIGCFGNDHYITHGIHGRAILESEGYHRHALVCERHIGVGLTTKDIREQGLPLPCRDMSPTCIEEEIISFADLFYSKKPGRLEIEASATKIRKKLAQFGGHKVVIFEKWLERFGE
jgi:uncharacterized protein